LNVFKIFRLWRSTTAMRSLPASATYNRDRLATSAEGWRPARSRVRGKSVPSTRVPKIDTVSAPQAET
jgi:hypothetical protein